MPQDVIAAAFCHFGSDSGDEEKRLSRCAMSMDMRRKDQLRSSTPFDVSVILRIAVAWTVVIFASPCSREVSRIASARNRYPKLSGRQYSARDWTPW